MDTYTTLSLEVVALLAADETVALHVFVNFPLKYSTHHADHTKLTNTVLLSPLLKGLTEFKLI